MQAIRPSLYELWFDKPPTIADMPTYPATMNKLVYGTNGTTWGWFIDSATESRPYICHSTTLNAKYLRPNGRTIDYGQNDTTFISRGPCFVDQPVDAWLLRNIPLFISGSDQGLTNVYFTGSCVESNLKVLYHSSALQMEILLQTTGGINWA